MDRRAFLLTTAGAALAAPVVARTPEAALQDRLEQLRADAAIPALGGALVTPDGLAWQGVSGLRRADGETVVTHADRWQLGSNTKAMTAALYARLVEQGRAAWGAGLSQLFADLDLDPAWDGVSIEHLLSHRAGIQDSVVMPDWMLFAWGDPDVRILRNRLARDVLGAAPGEVGGFSYSNAGYILAGAAIERITGEPWEDTMRREVFEPLGMASAGFGAPLGDNAWGHRHTTLQPRDPTAPIADNPAALGPAGTVHASLEDYARFLRVFLTGGGGWLSPESLDILTRPAAGPPPAYAAGWRIVASATWAGSRPALIHDGSNTFWLARALVTPGRNAAVICVANAAEPARGAVDALTRALIEHLPVR